MDKENALNNFYENIKKSWTYEKLTAEERKRRRKKAMDCVPKLSNEQLEQIIKWAERG